MATPGTATSTAEAGDERARYGLFVVLLGLGVVLLAFWLALKYYDFAGSIKSAAASSSAVAAVLAPVTSVVGTIVGAYFGYQAGAAGKAKAEDARDRAEVKASQLAAVAPTNMAAPILGVDPSVLRNARDSE